MSLIGKPITALDLAADRRKRSGPGTGPALLERYIADQRKNPPPGTRWSLVAFCRLVGVSKTNLNLWRRGLQRPTKPNAMRLAEHTNGAVPVRSWRKR
jgi:hypothetical protein